MQDNTNHLFAILTHADAPILRFNMLCGITIGFDFKVS